jgi:hypothetical protein
MDRDTAIRTTHPTVVTINAEKDAWDKDGNTVVLDEAKIATELAKLQAEWNNKDYARKRKVEYAKLNQFEMQFDDQRDGTTTWVDAINGIKDKYPK